MTGATAAAALATEGDAGSGEVVARDAVVCADGDGAVCHVEGGEVHAAPVEVQKVHHIAVQQAVNYVTDGATQNAGHGKAEQALARVRAQHPHNGNHRNNTNSGKKPTLPATCIGEDGKRRPSIEKMYEVKPRSDFNRFP